MTIQRLPLSQSWVNTCVNPPPYFAHSLCRERRQGAKWAGGVCSVHCSTRQSAEQQPRPVPAQLPAALLVLSATRPVQDLDPQDPTAHQLLGRSVEGFIWFCKVVVSLLYNYVLGHWEINVVKTSFVLKCFLSRLEISLVTVPFFSFTYKLNIVHKLVGFHCCSQLSSVEYDVIIAQRPRKHYCPSSFFPFFINVWITQVPAIKYYSELFASSFFSLQGHIRKSY